jgi:hypothetical protein
VRIHRREHPVFTRHVMRPRRHRAQRRPSQHILGGGRVGAEQVRQVGMTGRKLEHFDLVAAGQAFAQPGRELGAGELSLRPDLGEIAGHSRELEISSPGHALEMDLRPARRRFGAYAPPPTPAPGTCPATLRRRRAPGWRDRSPRAPSPCDHLDHADLAPRGPGADGIDAMCRVQDEEPG